MKTLTLAITPNPNINGNSSKSGSGGGANPVGSPPDPYLGLAAILSTIPHETLVSCLVGVLKANPTEALMGGLSGVVRNDPDAAERALRASLGRISGAANSTAGTSANSSGGTSSGGSGISGGTSSGGSGISGGPGLNPRAAPDAGTDPERAGGSGAEPGGNPPPWPCEECPHWSDLHRAFWTSLHVLCAKYPEDPIHDVREAAARFFKDLGWLYPCQHCRNHYAGM